MRLFGLIGFPLKHSFSSRYFTDKFAREGRTDCAFENFELKNIDEIRQVLAEHPNIEGLAVTIPFKKKIIRLLDEGTEAVRQMVACNCVRIKDGKLYGYNTDVLGFEASFRKWIQPHHQKALILGTGGAADAVAYVFRKLGIEYLFVSRSSDFRPMTIPYKALAQALFDDHTIIVNCTPVGTYPNISECPPIPYDYITPKHYLFDLVYNPAETTFLKRGAEQGAITSNGYEMLVLQAEENWKIWNAND
ncbi:MAG TPA: shikimate dehydrogenase [Chitinophagaceae bacterium]